MTGRGPPFPAVSSAKPPNPPGEAGRLVELLQLLQRVRPQSWQGRCLRVGCQSYDQCPEQVRHRIIICFVLTKLSREDRGGAGEEGSSGSCPTSAADDAQSSSTSDEQSPAPTASSRSRGHPQADLGGQPSRSPATICT
jgi:hypothetical protein